jgi:hypothetical protein
MVWLMSGGDWWLLLQQPSRDLVAVGYYPQSVFRGGQMTKYAQSVDFGGETASDSSQSGQMGSGAFANTGWGYAAYQRNISYTDKSGKDHPAKLKAGQATKSCYTIDVHNKTSGGWGTYFFFGGPRCPN